MALKKDAYYCAAFNLATSIKYFNPNIHITLLSDGGHRKTFRAIDYSVFDWIMDIDQNDMADSDGKFCPAKAKLNLNKYAMYDNTLYIDADSLVLQDIQPMIDRLIEKGGEFYSQYFDTGGINDDIQYNVWAKNELIWKFFGLKSDDKLITINSSWIFFTNKANKIFKKANKFYKQNFGLDNLSVKWGNTMPDELYFVGTLANLKVNPNSDIDAMFFGNVLDKRLLTELSEQYYCFTLYGGGVGRTTVRDAYITWYDRLMFKYLDKWSIEHRYKAHLILTNKHVNK